MCHIETVSIRDLRYRFPKVQLQRLWDRGETVKIAKRKRVVATLKPPVPLSAPMTEEDLKRLKLIPL